MGSSAVPGEGRGASPAHRLPPGARSPGRAVPGDTGGYRGMPGGPEGTGGPGGTGGSRPVPVPAAAPGTSRERAPGARLPQPSPLAIARHRTDGRTDGGTDASPSPRRTRREPLSLSPVQPRPGMPWRLRTCRGVLGSRRRVPRTPGGRAGGREGGFVTTRKSRGSAPSL